MSIEKIESYRPDDDKFVTRVVLRRVEERNEVYCFACDKSIKFNARKKPNQVIANVYDENGVWQSTEVYHQECYESLDQPYGHPYAGSAPMTQREYRLRLRHLIHVQDEQAAS